MVGVVVSETTRETPTATLRVTASLGLTLPFAFVPGDDAFLPEYVSVGEHAVWVSSDRGVSCVPATSTIGVSGSPTRSRCSCWKRKRIAGLVGRTE